MIRKALRRIPTYLPNMRLLVEYVMITSLVSLAAHAVLSWVNHAKLTQRATYIQEQVASMERALNESNDECGTTCRNRAITFVTQQRQPRRGSAEVRP